MKELKYKDNTTNSKKRIWDESENERGDSTLQIHEPNCTNGGPVRVHVKDGKIVDKL